MYGYIYIESARKKVCAVMLCYVWNDWMMNRNECDK